MIKNIIFDFGDVFINLNKDIVYSKIEKLGFSTEPLQEFQTLNNAYEVGTLSSNEFVEGVHALYPRISKQQIVALWNGMIMDFPEERLKFIMSLAQENNYRLFLLSNTNALHIAKVEQSMGTQRYTSFKACFEQFYLSHEIGLRKPQPQIYEFVLKENELKAAETFFIDDTKENTMAAENMGIRCWNLLVGQEDIVQLKTRL